jgi:hypothetical protein
VVGPTPCGGVSPGPLQVVEEVPEVELAGCRCPGFVIAAVVSYYVPPEAHVLV